MMLHNRVVRKNNSCKVLNRQEETLHGRNQRLDTLRNNINFHGKLHALHHIVISIEIAWVHVPYNFPYAAKLKTTETLKIKNYCHFKLISKIGIECIQQWYSTLWIWTDFTVLKKRKHCIPLRRTTCDSWQCVNTTWATRLTYCCW